MVFTGFFRSTVGNEFLNLATTSVTSVTNLSNAQTKTTIGAANVILAGTLDMSTHDLDNVADIDAQTGAIGTLGATSATIGSLIVNTAADINATLDMHTHKIVNVTDPTLPQDAATRAYVLSNVVSDHGSLTGLGDDDHTQYLRTDGLRVMTGDLDIGLHDLDNVADIDAQTGAIGTLGVTSATIGSLIVNTAADINVALNMHLHDLDNVADIDAQTGAIGTLGATTATVGSLIVNTAADINTSLDMHTHKIANVTDPTLPQDAATKKYVGDVTDGIYLPISGKAADSELLDNINSTSFLRSDVSDTFNGTQLTLDTDVVIDTNNGTKALYVTRTGYTSNEWLKMWIEDTITHQYYNNDETTGSIKWTIENTDTETGGGVGANTTIMQLYGEAANPRLTVAGDLVWTGGNDGSGSGLDADTVDSIEGAAIMQKSGGTFTGSVSMSGNDVTNVDQLGFISGSEITEADAYTLRYDAETYHTFRTGGTLSNILKLYSETIEVYGALYSDGILTLRSSGTNDIKFDAGGNIDADSNIIENVATPTLSHHAATMAYVDDNAGLWEVDGTETQLKVADDIDMQGQDIRCVDSIVSNTATNLTLESATGIFVFKAT
jgi:hypothetical protein